MNMKSSFPRAGSRLVAAFFKSLGPRVFRQSDLSSVLDEHRHEWGLPASMTVSTFISALVGDELVKRVSLRSEKYRDLVRYAIDDPSPFLLGASIGQHSYLSHGTAMFLNGITDQLAKTIYVNDEQRPKAFPPGVITQQGIDVAFSRQQRISSNVYVDGTTRYLVVSGKSTGRLEVTERRTPDGGTVDTTKLERTLIDIAVRPEYAGGPHVVRDAYAAARDRVSVTVLVATLKALDYAYPYNQVIGLYMERAGYETTRLDALRKIGLRFKFYLSYGIRDPDYDKSWQLFVPKGF